MNYHQLSECVSKLNEYCIEYYFVLMSNDFLNLLFLAFIRSEKKLFFYFFVKHFIDLQKIQKSIDMIENRNRRILNLE